jgi:hypothetical protein
MSDQPVARPLPKHRTAQIHTKHPCLEWDSNPRSQRLASEDCSCLRPIGYRDRRGNYTLKNIHNTIYVFICGMLDFLKQNVEIWSFEVEVTSAASYMPSSSSTSSSIYDCMSIPRSDTLQCGLYNMQMHKHFWEMFQRKVMDVDPICISLYGSIFIQFTENRWRLIWALRKLDQ